MDLRARSPDLTPLDFYFWGHSKSVVYCTKSITVDELDDRTELLTSTPAPNLILTAILQKLQKYKPKIFKLVLQSPQPQKNITNFIIIVTFKNDVEILLY